MDKKVLIDCKLRIIGSDPILAARWVADILKGELNYRNMSIDNFPVKEMRILLFLISEGVITDKVGIEIIRKVLDEQKTIKEIIKSDKDLYYFVINKLAFGG